MFYAHFVLTKKGPLAKIWLAAHWDKKLTKAHVFETNITSSVEAILEPKVKMALRTSGHLLLGVVKIYNRKAKYLLADCNEAFVKIKMAFRPGAVDLPEKSREAAAAAITLPDNLQDFESDDLTHVTDQLNVSVVHTSRPEDITLKEMDTNDSEINLGRPDDDFGEAALEMMRDTGAESLYSSAQADDLPSIDHGRSTVSGQHQDSTLVDIDNAEDEIMLPGGDDDDGDDGFGGDFEPTELFNDPSAKEHLYNVVSEIEGHLHPPATTGIDSTAGQLPTASSVITDQDSTRYALPPLPDITAASTASAAPHHGAVGGSGPSEPSLKSTPTVATNRRMRRRRLVIDDQKSIPSDLMKAHMQDTSEIVTVLDLAPPTKKLMQWKETGSVDRLLTHTARLQLSDRLLKVFSQNARTRPAAAEPAPEPDEDAEMRVIEEYITSQRQTEQPVPMTPAHMATGMTPIREELSHGLISTNTDPLIASSAPADQPLIPKSMPLPAAGGDTPFPFQHGDGEAAGMMSADIEHAGPPSVFNPNLTAEEDLDRQIVSEDADEVTEEAKTERRGVAMLKVLQHRFDGRAASELCTFAELTAGNSRKAAAAKFYTLLTLSKARGVQLAQNEGPFTHIHVQKGPRFGALLSAS